MPVDLHRTANRLLRAVPPTERFLASLERVKLEKGEELERPDTPVTHVHFPESGLLSVLATARSRKIEVGMIGFEGMTGSSVVLGAPPAHVILVQSPGVVLRLPVEEFRASLAVPAVQARWLHYVHVLMVQATQTGLANGQGSLVERLARWILMWHDRIREPEIDVTHGYISILLGVRRAGVTVAMHRLEGDRLIRSTRNRITVLNRDGLVRAANGFYGVPEAEYDRLLGPAPPRPGYVRVRTGNDPQGPAFTGRPLA
jgi:CRP-like cAMP-binding protein